MQSGPSVVKKQQRRSLENKKTTKSTTVCLPQRKLTLKKSTAQVQPRVKGMKVLFLSPLGYYFFSWLAEPMPFACRNTLYDEHWSSKQERGVYFISAFDFIYIYIYIYIRSLPAFTRWLNYVLAPADNFGNTIPSSGRAGKYCTIQQAEIVGE